MPVHLRVIVVVTAFARSLVREIVNDVRTSGGNGDTTVVRCFLEYVFDLLHRFNDNCFVVDLGCLVRTLRNWVAFVAMFIRIFTFNAEGHVLVYVDDFGLLF